MPPKRQQKGEPGYAAPKPATDELLATKARVNQTSADFLRVDVQTALTFTGIALQTEDPVKKRRNRRAARKAYDTVLRIMQKVDLSDNDAQHLAINLRRLKSELQNLGEAF